MTHSCFCPRDQVFNCTSSGGVVSSVCLNPQVVTVVPRLYPARSCCLDVANYQMDLRRRRSAQDSKPATPSRGGCVFSQVGSHLGLLLLFFASGCAVHYGNPRTGAEHLWGLGQLRLQTESQATNSNWAVVASGYRVPGVCLSVGRDHFGVTLGYLDRQQLVVLARDQIPGLYPPTNSLGRLWRHDANARWAFGHLRMRATGSTHRPKAIVTGWAVVGLVVGAGGGQTSAGLAMDSRQLALIQDENVHLEFDQHAPRWPGYDLFATQVQLLDEAMTPTNK